MDWLDRSSARPAAVSEELLHIGEVQVKISKQVSVLARWGVDNFMWTCTQFFLATFKKVIP
jgi:hypothetical protein